MLIYTMSDDEIFVQKLGRLSWLFISAWSCTKRWSDEHICIQFSRLCHSVTQLSHHVWSWIKDFDPWLSNLSCTIAYWNLCKMLHFLCILSLECLSFNLVFNYLQNKMIYTWLLSIIRFSTNEYITHVDLFMTLSSIDNGEPSFSLHSQSNLFLYSCYIYHAKSHWLRRGKTMWKVVYKIKTSLEINTKNVLLVLQSESFNNL